MAFFSPEQVIYISGAGSGIGRASALQFVADGAQNFALVDIASETLKETGDLLSSRKSDVNILRVVADLTNEEEVNRVFSEIQSKFSRLDVAINCAGILGKVSPTELPSSADMDKLMDINYRAVWLCEMAAIRQFLSQDERPLVTGQPFTARGSIVNVSSIFGIAGNKFAQPYTVSKHAVIGITKTDAMKYGEKGIRVNAICPGYTKTNLLPQQMWDSIAPMIATIPAGRLGTPEEIAFVVSFLASDRASFITGSSIVADGGYTV